MYAYVCVWYVCVVYTCVCEGVHRGQRRAWGVLLCPSPVSFEEGSLIEIGACTFDRLAASQQAPEIILHLPLSVLELQVCVRLHLATGWDLTSSPVLVNKCSCTWGHLFRPYI